MQAGTRLSITGVVLVATTAIAALTSLRAQETGERARVPTSLANIHDAPSTASNLLLAVPEGTELPVIGRQGEWIHVRLSPELRETGLIIRWYAGKHELIRRGERITIGDEDNGWMHDSTVEIISPGGQ